MILNSKIVNGNLLVKVLLNSVKELDKSLLVLILDSSELAALQQLPHAARNTWNPW